MESLPHLQASSVASSGQIPLKNSKTHVCLDCNKSEWATLMHAQKTGQFWRSEGYFRWDGF